VKLNDPHRRAFSLIEIMAVMACLGIGLSIGAVTLAAAMRSNQLAAGTLLHLRLRSEIADMFRSDVALADSLLESDGANSRSSTCLILNKSDGERVIYESRDGELIRTVRTSTGETKTSFRLGDPNATIEFPAPDARSKLVTMVIVDSPPRGTTRRTEISAALGGDRR
jgi:prepilin-type N-terminal cleavage/methylation domain-containing protein